MILKNKQEPLPFSDEQLEKFLDSLHWSKPERRNRREYFYANRIEISNKSVILGLLLKRDTRFVINGWRYEVLVGRISKYDTNKLLDENRSIVRRFLSGRKL